MIVFIGQIAAHQQMSSVHWRSALVQSANRGRSSFANERSAGCLLAANYLSTVYVFPLLIFLLVLIVV